MSLNSCFGAAFSLVGVNLTPWLRQKLKARRQREEGHRNGDEVGDVGVSNDVSLHRMPSSTSVFRAPSSVERA
jgi:hypothetical protein